MYKDKNGNIREINNYFYGYAGRTIEKKIYDSEGNLLSENTKFEKFDYDEGWG